MLLDKLGNKRNAPLEPRSFFGCVNNLIGLLQRLSKREAQTCCQHRGF
jgi:hypothetical protein